MSSRTNSLHLLIDLGCGRIEYDRTLELSMRKCCLGR
jgi:hypothetical protein